MGWAGVTSFLAIDALSAWLGTPNRRFGFLALVVTAAAFVAGQTLDGNGRRRLARSATVGLLALALLAGLEALGVGWLQSSLSTDRLGSTLGSPAYLGAALCLLIPIAVGVAFDDRRAWRAAGWAGAGLGVLVLGGSGTRGAAVGIGVAVGLAAVRFRRRIGPGLILVGAAVLVVLALSPIGQRALEGTEGRLAEWATASRAMADRPVVGTGLEGYRITFPTHVDVAYVRAYGRSTITDRAHSGPLDLGVAMGVPGIVAWIVASVWVVGRAWRVSASGRPIEVGLALGTVAWMSQELFLFPTFEVGVMGWAVIGAMAAAAPSGSSAATRSMAAAWLSAVLFGAVTVGAAAGVVADHTAARAADTGDIDSARFAAAVRPDSLLHRLLVAEIALEGGKVAAARSTLDDALRLVPRDPGLLIADARLLRIEVAQGAEAPAAAGRVGDIVADDPNHPELRLIHGDLLARSGDPARAERAWLAAEELSPDDPAPALRLASLYLAVGREDAARMALDRARAIDPNHPDIPGLEEMIDEA